MIVRKLEALFTINTNALQFQRATSELDRLADKAQSVMKGIASLWAVQALHNFVTNTAKAADQIGKTSLYLGITTDALQELHYAAEKSGVSIDALEDAIKEIQVRAYDAKGGTGEAAQAFKDLGLKATNAAGKIREPLDLLYETADRLKAVPHGDRVWMADAIFGDEGSRVLKMLMEGSSGVQKLREEARSLGHILKNETVKDAERFTEALKRLHTASQGGGRSLIADMFKPLSTVIEKLSDFVVGVNQVQVPMSLFQTLSLSLAAALGLVAIKASIALGPLLIVAAPVIAKLALLGAALMGLVLVVQDLWVAFNGGNSVIGALWGKYNTFCSRLEQRIVDLPRVIADSTDLAWKSITKGLKDAWVSATKEFDRFSLWFTNKLAWLSDVAKNLLAGIVPDVMKKGFFNTMKVVGGESHDSSSYLNHRLAPTPAHISSQNRISSNQNVNVAVNVKSQAYPQEIGSEVSKAVRQALERERFNAFMGVSQYAG